MGPAPAKAGRWTRFVCVLVLVLAPLMAIFEGVPGSTGWILQLDEIAVDDASETTNPLEGAAETDADAPEATRPRIERLPIVRASYLLDLPIPSRPSTDPRLDSIHRPPRA